MPIADMRNHRGYMSDGAQKRFDNDRQKAAKAYLADQPYEKSPIGMVPQFTKPIPDPPIRGRSRYQPPQYAAPSTVNPPTISNSGGPTPVPSLHGNKQLQAFLQSIAEQESGGDYGAVGVPTQYGTALGKYQILDSNMEGPGGWDMETLGKDIAVEQFLNSPQLQESIARAKLAEYFKDYGAEGAAKAWYAGPGNADSMSDDPQYGGPSIVDYSSSVLSNMQKYL